MALKPCRVCGKEVAEGARECPHCGAADPAPIVVKSRSPKPLVVVLGGLVLFAYCVNSYGRSLDREDADRETRVLSAYQSLVGQCAFNPSDSMPLGTVVGFELKPGGGVRAVVKLTEKLRVGLGQATDVFDYPKYASVWPCP